VVVSRLDGERAVARFPGADLPLTAVAEPGRSWWGAWVSAPADESGLPAAEAALAVLAESGPALLAVHGGGAYPRGLLAERARLHHRVPALVVDDGMDRDQAVTAILSGRTDLVGGSAEAVASWAVSK
jgi:anthraniloyl-CoA monooxygenase